MSRTGELLGGRFALVGDEATVVNNMQYLEKLLWRGKVELPLPEDELWVPAEDRETGARVRVAPRLSALSWGEDMRREAAARVVMRLGLPGVVPVLHVGPGVVYAEPGALPGWPRLSLADAAACTLRACEAAARLQAVGLTSELQVGPSHLRVLGGGEIAWVVPEIGSFAAVDMFASGCTFADREAQEQALEGVFGGPVNDNWSRRELVAQTVWDLAWMFFVLAWDEALVADERLAAVARVLLARSTETSAAELAGLLVPLTATPEVWAARVAALPVVRRPAAPAVDWDLVIADGEAVRETLASDPFMARHPGYVTVPLAAAYHQRASAACERGAYDEALGDATKAVEIDPTVAYHTTRAIVLDALGRTEEARVEIDAAFASLPPRSREDGYGRGLEPKYDEAELYVGRWPEPEEVARVYAARGAIGAREGAFVQAERDLRRAWELRPTAGRARALGAALFEMGRVKEAAALEASVVAAEPEEPGHRWALVVSLVRLGRAAEAQVHTEALLRLAPGVYDERVGRALAVGAE